MQIEYTILKGHLIADNDKCDISFALVFLEEGIYYVEAFLLDDTFFERHKNLSYYTLIGKTEKDYDIEIEGLFCKLYKTVNNKGEFICDSHIKLIDNRKNEYQKESVSHAKSSIYQIELYGLKMHFADHTKIEKYRRGSKLNEFFNSSFDHTTCALTINLPDILGNYYKLIFSKGIETNNIIIELPKDEGYNRLTFDNYLKFKTELISFLSFINGGHVEVKRELTGTHVTINQNRYVNAQTVYNYSVKEKAAQQLDEFIPINKHHSFSHAIVPHLFFHCFDMYVKQNKELDFNSLVFSLNNASETIGLEEKYFILITALERICNEYSKAIQHERQTLIDEEYFFNSIKPDLYSALEKHKSTIKGQNKNAWDIFRSKIGNLNKRNFSDTSQKLYEFFNYASIPINQKVINLIEVERNQAVHEGIIGKTEQEKVNNYLKLDHILRDVILNLIEYKSHRNYIYKYYE